LRVRTACEQRTEQYAWRQYQNERPFAFRAEAKLEARVAQPLFTNAPATQAQTDGSPSSCGRSQWQETRQEMMAACANKSAGTACSSSREGQPVSGTCHATRRGHLVCLTALTILVYKECVRESPKQSSKAVD